MGALHTKSGFHKSLFDSSIDGIIVINARGIIQDVNNAVVKLMGFTESEMIGQNINMLMGSPHHENHDGYLKRYQETREAKIIGIGREVMAKKKDGDSFPIRLAVTEFIHEGEVRYTGVIHDLTDEKKVKEKLKEYTNELEKKVLKRTERLEREVKLREEAQLAMMDSQKLYEAIASNFPNGTIGVLDTNFTILFMEGSDLKEMGFGSHQLVGENYLELIPDEVRDEVKAHLTEVLSGGNKVFEIYTGDKVYLGRSVPLTDEHGKIDKILQVDINITKQKQAEQEVLNALNKEKQLNEMKSNFVSMASHEFRTPLSSIKSSAALIKRYTQEDQQDKREKHINKITSNVNNLNMILNDFLSLEKIETGLVSNNPQALEITEFINEILEETSPLMKEGQKIAIKFGHQTETVLLDPFLLRNILNNLLSNAYKYSKEGGVVGVETKEEGGVFSIAIKDSGIGISETDQKQLFTRFFRASNASNIQGTGLGLNIVRRYAHLMDAQITFTSELNEGSTFVISFEYYG